MKTSVLTAIVAGILCAALGASIAGEPVEKDFVSLFDGKTLEGWHLMNGAEFVVRDGVIEHRGGLGWLRSENQYSDFVLHLEFRFLEPKQDGGVFLRAAMAGKRWPNQKYEVQIANTERMAKVFGVEYDLNIDLTQQALKPTGEWNAYEIKVAGPKLEVSLNGELVTTSTGLTKFRSGYIGLQGEDGAPEYRNIRIKDLSPLILSVGDFETAPIPGKDDRIGWSADGNRNDPDDWSATALALAIFAKMGWQEKLVHFDYNNRLDKSLDWKEAENHQSTIGGARRFRFNEEVFFDDQRELEAAIEHAKEEINKSHEGSKFWYVQAGPFEVAYQALLRADPEKRKYCILVSHSEINERPDKWKLADGSPSHGRIDCIALGAKYLSTTGQGKDKFGGRTFLKWDLVDWMKNSRCEEYRWVHSRFLATAKHKEGGLDASDGGMAYVLVTGDPDGNFNPKLKELLGTDWAQISVPDTEAENNAP
jgi:hypothetical protein